MTAETDKKKMQLIRIAIKHLENFNTQASSWKNFSGYNVKSTFSDFVFIDIDILLKCIIKGLYEVEKEFNHIKNNRPVDMETIMMSNIGYPPLRKSLIENSYFEKCNTLDSKKREIVMMLSNIDSDAFEEKEEYCTDYAYRLDFDPFREVEYEKINSWMDYLVELTKVVRLSRKVFFQMQTICGG